MARSRILWVSMADFEPPQSGSDKFEYTFVHCNSSVKCPWRQSLRTQHAAKTLSAYDIGILEGNCARRQVGSAWHLPIHNS